MQRTVLCRPQSLYQASPASGKQFNKQHQPKHGKDTETTLLSDPPQVPHADTPFNLPACLPIAPRLSDIHAWLVRYLACGKFPGGVPIEPPPLERNIYQNRAGTLKSHYEKMRLFCVCVFTCVCFAVDECKCFTSMGRARGVASGLHQQPGG